MNGNRSGFTIIEILVAILIFGILMVVLSSTLSGSLKLNHQAQQELSTTSGVQDVIEKIRNAWSVQANYDAVCVLGLSLPSGYTAKYMNLDSRANPITTPATNTITNTCPTTTVTPSTPVVMRRIQVSSGSGAQGASLELDVLRPRE